MADNASKRPPGGKKGRTPRAGGGQRKFPTARRNLPSVRASPTSDRDHLRTMPGEIPGDQEVAPPTERITQIASPRPPHAPGGGVVYQPAPSGGDEYQPTPSGHQRYQPAPSGGEEKLDADGEQEAPPSGDNEKELVPAASTSVDDGAVEATPLGGEGAGPDQAPPPPAAGEGEAGIWQADLEATLGQKNDGDLELTLRPEARDKEGLAQQAEVDFPTERVTSETERVTAETERVTAETERVTSETERVTAETERPTETQTETTEKGYKPLDYEKRQFDSLDPREYGIEFDDEEMDYERPSRDENLPDLYRLMSSLENDETDLDSRREPPSLFTQPEHAPRYKKISELKLRLEEEDIAAYVDEFEDRVRHDVLMIGAITLEDVQEEEKRLRDEHIQYEAQEAAVERQRQQRLIVKEEEAKKRVARDVKDKRRDVRRREEILQQKERLMLDRVHKAFRRAENQLISSLTQRKGEVTTMYGDLTLSDGHYGGSKGRRWKVDWEKTPQPIQIKLKCLRGVKDKIPNGRYVLMVSLYNRLGGHIMRWSNLKGQQWGGTTLPLTHDGHFYNSEIKVDQSVFTVLPSKPGVRPGMVLVFELFIMRGAVVPTDRVVGWACFPVTNGKFDVIEGKYNTPMLRGEMDPRIDKHERFEELVSSDIDHWLCNFYFEIVKLPRYLSGQKEYEVELEFSSGMLSYPDRIDTGGEVYRDGEVPVPGSVPEVHPPTSQASSQSNIGSGGDLSVGELHRSEATVHPASSGSDEQLPPYRSQSELSHHDYTKKQSRQYDTKTGRPPSVLSQHYYNKKGKSHDQLEDYFDKGGEKRDAQHDASLRQRRPMTTYGSRHVHKGQRVKVTSGSDESDDDNDDDLHRSKQDGFLPVKGQPGMYYKRYPNNPVDEYHRQLYTLLPRTPVLARRKRNKRVTYQQELEEHSFSVMDRFADAGRLSDAGSEKLSYLRRQFMAELGLSQWRSREFWGMVVMFIIIFFGRMYLHYVGQWLLLQALGLPVNKFDFFPYTVNLNYQNTLLTTREEIGVVLVGPFFIISLFALLVLIVWLLQLTVGSFPDMISKFVVVFGIEAFLDWLLVLIIDAALLRYRNLGGDNPIGDFAKLYWHFMIEQGSGVAGILITIFLYTFCCFTAGAILYMYFLRLHNNGRMLDIYWRLHGGEDVFFVPYDLELSNHELSFLVRHAEQWRGEDGERRKVAVYDYVWEEETVDDGIWDENEERREMMRESKREITTHISIHTVHLDGLRELYRHFLRLPDGAILEVFGDMAISGVDKETMGAVSTGAQNLENLQGSHRTTKVPGRQTAFTTAGFNLGDEEGATSSGSQDSVTKMAYREVAPDTT